MGPIQFPSDNKPFQGSKIIKKYGNRKLYDTEQSSYVVLKDIEKMIRNKEKIQVIDNETQQDITIPTLTQIIFSSEKKSKVSPPLDILQTIICEGDGSFSSFLAKLGVFTVDETEIQNQQDKLAKNASSDNSVNEEGTQSLEQKITSLMSSGDGNQASSTEDVVPELPGSRLS